MRVPVVSEESVQAFEDETRRAWLITILVDLRLKQGLKQADVARRMGVTQQVVSYFERNGQEGHDVSVSTVQRYARAVGVELRMWIEPKMVEPPVDKTEGSGQEVTPDA